MRYIHSYSLDKRYQMFAVDFKIPNAVTLTLPLSKYSRKRTRSNSHLNPSFPEKLEMLRKPKRPRLATTSFSEGSESYSTLDGLTSHIVSKLSDVNIVDLVILR